MRSGATVRTTSGCPTVPDTPSIRVECGLSIAAEVDPVVADRGGSRCSGSGPSSSEELHVLSRKNATPSAVMSGAIRGASRSGR